MKKTKKIAKEPAKRGKGRPKLYGDDPITTAILLPRDAWERLGAKADSAGVSRNHLAALAIMRASV